MRSRVLTAFWIAVAAVSLTGCVIYRLPGIPMNAGAADPYMQNLARQALRNQNAYAQLELGIRYEEGRGVPLNYYWAEEFYKSAARDWGGGTWNMAAGGKMSFVAGGRRHKGLPEARRRLEALRAKRAALRR